MSESIDVPTLRRQRGAGDPVQLVDVRSASEYATGHIPGAVSTPLDQLESRLQDLGPQPLDAQHHAGVEDAVRHCLIHNTLLDPPEIRIEIKANALLPQ